LIASENVLYGGLFIMKKNRILKQVVALVICMLLLVGCGNNISSADNKKISIVCTTFPQYDWVREIIGDKAKDFDLTLLLDNGVDLHSYQPTAEDIAKIGAADIFIYVGGESDGWVKDALEEATNKNLQAINMLDVLGNDVKEEKVVEGMQGDEAENSSVNQVDKISDSQKEDEVEYDEHVWLSLKNAKVLVNAISEAITQTDKENAESYTTNATTYINKLDELNNQYEQVVSTAKFNTVLFGDRFPFRYLVDDYGLNYYAAFVGCSAETEASFETITFLAGKVDELGLNSILVIENSDKKIAETIKKNTANKNQNILVLNSIQSITKTDLENGFTYLKAMQDNLDVLKQALN
jgi:zinc transport system substrate-binding protein